MNSAAGSKVDFYQDRDLRYAIDLQSDGFGVADLDVTLHNDAPTTGQPGYVIGPARSDDGEPSSNTFRRVRAWPWSTRTAGPIACP